MDFDIKPETNPETNPEVNPETNPYYQLFIEIGIIDQLVTARFDKAMPYGLTLAQFGVLNHFARHQTPALSDADGRVVRSPAQLARTFQVARATMTSTLQKLSNKGFVTIEPHPTDKRSKCVTLSERGYQARNQAVRRAAPQFADIIAAFSEVDIAAAMPFLQALREWLDQHR